MDKQYVQCLHCGRIYTTSKRFSYEYSIIESTCPCCGCQKGLNCENDPYQFYDPTLDNRSFMYEKGD